MLLMGDEVRRTQQGNNNAYCQDGDISWFDWSLLERHAGIHRFVKALNAFRQRRDVEKAPLVTQATYLAQPRSVVLLALALRRAPKALHKRVDPMPIHVLAGKPAPRGVQLIHERAH